MKSQAGLTLIELMIVLCIAAVLLGVAVPAFSNGLEASRAAGARADLLASLSAAATRAGITGVRSVLCPSLDGLACADSPDWSQGWLVFLDTNASRELEGGERILRVQPALAGQVRLRSTVGRTRIVFQGNGGNVGSNATFTLCDGRGPARARALIMSNTGGLRDGTATPVNLAATCPH